MNTKTLHRKNDPQTSQQAAAKLLPTLSERQALVLDAFRERGPMTSKEAEQLPRFSTWGYSSVRKRATELERLGYLERLDEKRDGCFIYRAVYTEILLERLQAEANGCMF